MAVTYTNRVISLKKNNGAHLNTVKSAVIEVTASNGTNQFSKEYEIDFLGSIEPDDFIPYELLTEATVLSWYEENGPETQFIKDEMKTLLEKDSFDETSNFPWV